MDAEFGGDRRLFQRQELSRILLALGIDTWEMHHSGECYFAECDQETPPQLKVALKAACGTYELCRIVQEMSAYVLARDRADCVLSPREQRLLGKLEETELAPFLQEEVTEIARKVAGEAGPTPVQVLLPARPVFRV